jgi:hypothetical protein
MIDALSRAMAEPTGVPLFGNKKTPGLFATTAAAKPIAQRCQQEGLVRTIQTENRGKQVLEICTITEKGLAFLLGQVSPKQVLEDLVRTLQARQVQVEELVHAARQWQTGLESLQSTVARILQQLQQPGSLIGPGPSANGSDVWLAEVLAYLAQWHASGASGDCPLPDLFRRAKGMKPSLTIGHFHDGLRRLHDQEKIYLHPWTGPLYDIPEPPYALLVGHEIAYYASLRGADKVTGDI